MGRSGGCDGDRSVRCGQLEFVRQNHTERMAKVFSLA